MIRLNQITLKNIRYFIQGNFRKFVEDFPGVVDDHIYEQVQYRIGIMNEECLKKKQCIHCGCSVPELQYSDKSCDNNCYPVMMNDQQWEEYKKINNITKDTICLNLFKRKKLL